MRRPRGGVRAEDYFCSTVTLMIVPVKALSFCW
jgi:hypothetical protein